MARGEPPSLGKSRIRVWLALFAASQRPSGLIVTWSIPLVSSGSWSGCAAWTTSRIRATGPRHRTSTASFLASGVSKRPRLPRA